MIKQPITINSAKVVGEHKDFDVYLPDTGYYIGANYASSDSEGKNEIPLHHNGLVFHGNFHQGLVVTLPFVSEEEDIIFWLWILDEFNVPKGV